MLLAKITPCNPMLHGEAGHGLKRLYISPPEQAPPTEHKFV